jgi:hypothetical protein
MDMGVAFFIELRGAAAGSLGAYIAASRKIVQCAEKIIGKNQEEMFAFRKRIEGKNFMRLGCSNAAKPLADSLLFFREAFS